MNNLDIYCVTNRKLSFLEKTSLKLVGVGQDNFSDNYIKCNTKENIYYKEKYYSELTFHYWYWKNILPKEKNVARFAFASVVSTKNIFSGEILNKKNIWVKRPGNGDFLAVNYNKLIGKKVKKNILANRQIKKTDIF